MQRVTCCIVSQWVGRAAVQNTHMTQVTKVFVFDYLGMKLKSLKNFDEIAVKPNNQAPWAVLCCWLLLTLIKLAYIFVHFQTTKKVKNLKKRNIKNLSTCIICSSLLILCPLYVSYISACTSQLQCVEPTAYWLTVLQQQHSCPQHCWWRSMSQLVPRVIRYPHICCN